MSGKEEKDIEMKEAAAPEEVKKKSTEDRLRMSLTSIASTRGDDDKEEEISAADARALLVSQLKANIALCEKTAQTKEIRFLLRVLRRNSFLRKRMTKEVLLEFISTYFPANNQQRDNLLNFINSVPDPLDVLDSPMVDRDAAEPAALEKQTEIGPEVEIYLSLLVLIFLIDQRQYELAEDYSASLIELLKKAEFNVRTLDPLRAKVFFYFSRGFELRGKLDAIRGELLGAYRTSTLRHDSITQSSVLNLLLRNYLEYNLFDQADKLVSNIGDANEVASSSNQHARFLYYTGRIKAIQLEYTEASKRLSEALRKAPQSSGFGFRRTVQKLLCIVQLLTGEIPEISVFRQSGMKAALAPYFQLTKAVRVGDLVAFQEAVRAHRDAFVADQTYTLIQRLRRNVIKTGLRKINVAYSRISLQDICQKLRLDSVEDTEFIVAKAIKDRVIDATIDHDGSFLKSRETMDIYSTQEPLEAFHKRINFCLNIHNDAVMAMRYPTKPRTETDEERKDRLRIEQELQEELEDEDDLDFLD